MDEQIIILGDAETTRESDALAGAPFSLSPGSQVDIPDVHPTQVPVPQRIIVRELTIDESDSAGPFVFKQPDQSHPCTQLSDISQMITRIRTNSYVHRPNAAPYDRPLDLNLQVSTCFIIRLSPKWAWRFSSTLKGAMLGQLPPGEKNNYYNLRHVLDSGVEGPDPFDEVEFCRLIYFVATPVSAGFEHAFNLNIEFVYPGGTVPSKKPNTVPIVIDPDVRHPGGSAD